MTRTDDILDAAASVADPTVDRAMAAALPTATPGVAVQLTRRLLERRCPDAQTALVLHFQALPDEARDAVAAVADDLFRPLREACAAGGDHGPLNAIDIIRRARTTGLAYLIAERLRHGSENVRQAAGRCLLDMAQDVARDPGPALERLGDVAAAVEDSVRLYAHHQQPDVLLALCTLLPREMDASLAALAKPDGAAVRPMRRILAAAEHPQVRRVLLALLPIPTLTQSVGAGLRQAAAAGQLGEATACHHLLARPDARRALNKLGAVESIWPGPGRLMGLPASEQIGLIALLEALPLEDAVKLQRLEELSRSEHPAVRVRVLRAVLNQPLKASSRPADRLIESLIEDPAEPIARLAVRRVLQSHPDRLPKLLARLVNSPHAAVRQLAGRRIAPIAFDRFWRRWPTLDPARRLAAGRALIKIDADFHRLLADKLAARHAPTRLRALAIISGLNQGAFFEPALIQLTQEGDEKVASAAVRALGAAGSSRAYGVLREMLDHADARVRANAVEALAEADAALCADRFADMADREDNRPRANAIAALMQMRRPEAMGTLTRMLHDARPRHRTSALWLVETMGLVEAARHVAELSISDEDDAVKDRADRVIRELLELMSSAPPPEAVSEAGYRTMVYK